MEQAEDAAFGAVAPYYDQLMAGVPYRFWVRYLQQLWDHFATQPFTVLDLACGTGTVALMLAERGYQVTGVDSSCAMLGQARKKAARAGARVDFVQQDAAELDLPDRPYDAIVCLFDSLNNIVEPARLQEAFRRAWAHTAEGGYFIFDINTEYAFLAGLFNQKSSMFESPLHYAWQASYDRGLRLCTITMDFSFVRDGAPAHRFQEVHVQRAYAKSEILSMLEEAGFGEVSVFDAYTLSLPRRRSDRVFYVARRPKLEL